MVFMTHETNIGWGNHMSYLKQNCQLLSIIYLNPNKHQTECCLSSFNSVIYTTFYNPYFSIKHK